LNTTDELAHQWFGNLVTMDWWDELWLNESFATWAGWYAVNEFHPDWQVWAQFVVRFVFSFMFCFAWPSICSYPR
jgi:aminopeptidase N